MNVNSIRIFRSSSMWMLHDPSERLNGPSRVEYAWMMPRPYNCINYAYYCRPRKGINHDQWSSIWRPELHWMEVSESVSSMFWADREFISECSNLQWIRSRRLLSPHAPISMKLGECSDHGEACAQMGLIEILGRLIIDCLWITWGNKLAMKYW